MIINKVLGGGGNTATAKSPFTSVVTKTFDRYYVPKCLAYNEGVWMFGGKLNNCVAMSWWDSANDDLPVSRLTDTSGLGAQAVGLSSVGDTGYIVGLYEFPSAQVYGQQVFFKEMAVTGLTNTDFALNGYNFHIPVVSLGADMLVDGKLILSIGYSRNDNADQTNSQFFDMESQTAQSTYNGTWNEHGSNAIKLSQDGNRVFGMNSSGFVRYRGTGLEPKYWGASVGEAAGTTDGVTATSLLAVNNYCIVGGSKADGTYIWYVSGTITEGMTFTAKRIYDRPCTVIGIAYASNKYIVAYKVDNQVHFWVSKPNDITTASAIDYYDSAISGIDGETFVDMKGNGSEAMLLSYSPNVAAHVTIIK